MARSKAPNGHDRLEEAIALLINTQASFLARVAETDRELAASRREAAERFARIEKILLEHSRILQDHSRILQALPEAIREKIGFKAPDR